MGRQATRCNETERHLHVQRQRALGERLASDHDRPRWPEIAAFLVVLAGAGAYAYGHNLLPFS